MKILALTDEKWKLFEGFFCKSNRGRPMKWSDREILEAVLYVLHTGCQWRQLPQKYPPHQTVYGRFRRWERQVLNRFEKKLSVFQAFLDLFVTFTLIKDLSTQPMGDL